MKKLKFIYSSFMTIALLFLSLFFVRVPIRASTGYIEDEGFATYHYDFFETGGSVSIRFTYPKVVLENRVITINIELISVPSDDETFVINRVDFFGSSYTVTITEFESDEVDLLIDPSFFSLGSSNITLTSLRYVYKGFTRSKTDDIDMPITVFESELDYYKQRYYELKDEIEDLEDALSSEFNRGYEEGHDVGFDEGYNFGYDVGFDEGLLASDYFEAYQEGFRDGEKSKLAENNEAFYTGIGKWLVPAIIAVIVLGGIVSIASIKRREQ